jgi:uncharacterized membrane-anchored protein
MSTWITRVGAVLLLQLGLVAIAVAPQLSARATGEEYLLRVEPVDPIDPFRGAYVALTYPDLRLDDAGEIEEGNRGTVFVSLVERDGVWVMQELSPVRPDHGPYLACDDRSWELRCGIESYFLPQDDAREFESLVAGGTAVARIRIDGRGHAALITVEER